MPAEPASGRVFGALLLAAVALGGGPGGCGPKAADPGRQTRAAPPAAPDGDEGLGINWQETRSGQGALAAAPAIDPTVWAVVLATFPKGAQPDAPRKFATQLHTLFPQLADVWIHAGPDGTVVACGHYDDPQDANAQRDLKAIKDLKIKNSPAFPLAMLSRVGSAPAQLGPLSLMSLRKRFPNVEPLYTLEVAVWGDFDANKVPLAEIHAKSEAYARTLRSQGFEAWFYHDDYKRLSSVTVGHFDHTAIDPRTNLLSADVEALIARFPAHLVNGEPLNEPVAGRDPSRGTRVQKPTLVEVPKR